VNWCGKIRFPVYRHGPASYCQDLFTRLLNPKFFVMKNFRFSFVLAVCFLISSSAFSAPFGVDGSPNSELRKEVVKLIQAPELSKEGIAETFAFINFTVNERNEIVVLNVVSDSDYIREYIKQRLNKQKVDATGLEAFTEYNVKVAFRSEMAQ